jgi:hypothetical protein
MTEKIGMHETRLDPTPPRHSHGRPEISDLVLSLLPLHDAVTGGIKSCLSRHSNIFAYVGYLGN